MNLFKRISAFFDRLFNKKKRKEHLRNGISSNREYYISIDEDIYGPFSLAEVKKYPLLEDTLITAEGLDDWYEAKYWECFDDLIISHEEFIIREDGTIVRSQKKK